MRIVLTWDDPALDLDAHLEGPLPEGRQFHVYYHQPGDMDSREFVRLDTDARGGGGPETITVLGVVPGTYRYWVHDYTHGDKPQVSALARSGAQVKLYQGGQTYLFRTGHEMLGNVWDVCTIEVGPEAAVVQKVDQYRSLGTQALGLYAKRTLADRAQWIGRYGGTPQSEQAVSQGLEWLARHQAADGSWGPYCLGPGEGSCCEKPHVCTGEGEPYEMALTGLALLAFQAGGHYYFNNTIYSQTVRKGLDWIVERQKPDGALVGSKPRGGYPQYHKYHMYEHGIAAFALADACATARALGREPPEPYLKASERAVAFIEANQHTDGGWRYTPDLKRPGDSSVTGWQVLALSSAREAGIAVSRECIEKIRRFFKYRETGEYGRTGYDDRIPQTDATTGVGMLARQFLLDEPDAPLIREAAAYLADLAEIQWGDRRADESNTDYYLWYNCTLAMFQVGGGPWQRWNELVRDTIVGLQCHQGCERGSWNPNSRWGRFGGRIYTTALATLTLETYYRYTPQRELPAAANQWHTSPASEPAPAIPASGETEGETEAVPPAILPPRGDEQSSGATGLPQGSSAEPRDAGPPGGGVHGHPHRGGARRRTKRAAPGAARRARGRCFRAARNGPMNQWVERLAGARAEVCEATLSRLREAAQAVPADRPGRPHVARASVQAAFDALLACCRHEDDQPAQRWAAHLPAEEFSGEAPGADQWAVVDALEAAVRRWLLDTLAEKHAALAALEQVAQATARLRAQLLSRTRQAAAAAAYADADARKRAILESSLDPIITINHEGLIIEFNRAAEQVFGHARSKVLGTRPSEILFPPEPAGVQQERIDRYLEVGEGSLLGRRIEVTALRASGETFPAEMAMTISLEQGEPVLSFFVRDISQRKRAEEEQARYAAELERSNRELEQFAYVASHDLQEPLRKIRMFSDRLEMKCAQMLDETGRECIRRMQSAAARMQALIDGLLSLSRVTTRAQSFVPVDLAQIAREVVSDLETQIERVGGRVEIGHLPAIQADPLQMRQLFQNLIGNALKFHRVDEPPVVRVHGRFVQGRERRRSGGSLAEERCRIVVEDNGIGFEPRHSERIFGVFQRLHPRDVFEGTGVGLAICRRIVERHGGTITAQSTPGRGSTFEVVLPVVHPRSGKE